MAIQTRGFKDISTRYQEAYETLDGKVQVRKISARLWEILPRGRAALYEKSKPAALKAARKVSR